MMKKRIRNLLIVITATLLIACGWIAFVRHARIAKVIAFADTLSGDSQIRTDSYLPEVLQPLEEETGFYAFRFLDGVDLRKEEVPSGLFSFFHNARAVRLINCKIDEQDLHDLILNSSRLQYVAVSEFYEMRPAYEELVLPPTVTQLYLDGMFVSDTLVSRFPDFQHLEDLRLYTLSSKLLTDDSCKNIARNQSLKLLHINSASISDTGLEELSSLKRLEYFYLTNNKAVTPVGVRSLTNGPNRLKEIRLQHCSLTENDISELRSEYPQIEFSESPQIEIKAR